MLWKLRLHRHHYRSRIDGSVEPYCVYCPRGWRKRRDWPLLVLLHGYGGNERGFMRENMAALADRHGMVLLSVRGRGNTFYDRRAEEDIFRALAATRERYPIDPERVYLAGTSMGGTGVWRLATRFPDVFAAAIPVCGWTDPELWYPKWYGPEDDPAERADFHTPLLAEASALDAAENMLPVPVFALHGARDQTVSVEHSRRMVARLRRLGATVIYKEYARSGHKGFLSRWDGVLRWLNGGDATGWRDGRRRRLKGAGEPIRRAAAPRRVRYVTYTRRYRRAYWVEIDDLAATHQRARVDARWREDGRVDVAVENVTALTLRPPAEFLAGLDAVIVRVNGQLACEGPPPPALSLVLEGAHWRRVDAPLRPAGWRKRADLEGPIADAFTREFALVAGDAAEDRREAERFRAFWRGWMLPMDKQGRPRGTLPILTPAAARRRPRANLVLVGSAESNALIAAAAPHLPIVPRRDAVVAGGRRYPGAGLFMVYPDPANAERCLVLLHRRFPWRTKDLEGLPCVVPDYVIFDPGAPIRHSTHDAWRAFARNLAENDLAEEDVPEDERPLRYLPDCFLEAGFFDDQWRLRPRREKR